MRSTGTEVPTCDAVGAEPDGKLFAVRIVPSEQAVPGRSTPGLSWSHDALQGAVGVLVPDRIHQDLEAGQPPDLDGKLFTIGFELRDLQGEEILRAPAPPNASTAEAWWTRTYDALKRYDTHLLAAQHHYARAQKAREAGRASTKQEGHAYEKDRARAGSRRFIAAALHHGLLKRSGSYLTRDEEQVFIHLAARSGGCPRGIRVCEWCLRVFRSPRAKRCRKCRNKGRWTPQDYHTTSVMFGHEELRELQVVGHCQHPGCPGPSRCQSSPARASDTAKHTAALGGDTARSRQSAA